MELVKGTPVLVTGASSGIGAALARAFAARGCSVGLLARSGGRLTELAAELDGEGHRVLQADVGDADSVGAAIERFGACDVLVVNAGVASYAPIADLTLDQIEAMTLVNWLGTVYTVKAALPRMLQRQRGHVVVISSAAALRGFPSAAAYGATKAAQRVFAEGLRHELSTRGISVTSVFPGQMNTSLHDHERSSMPDWHRSEEPGSPHHLAEQVVKAVARGQHTVYRPRSVRTLRVLQGLSPALTDMILKRRLGSSATQ